MLQNSGACVKNAYQGISQLIKADCMSLSTFSSHNMSLAAHDMLWQLNLYGSMYVA